MDILITGVAGFIGSAVAKSLLSRGDFVVGIDNLNDCYDGAENRSYKACFSTNTEVSS
jgi:nucleoside-diphosphate-sugar epimerase